MFNDHKKSTYMVATSFQLLQSAGIAAFYDSTETKYLIIISDFKDPELFIRALKKWKNNPFSRIILLNGRYDVSNRGTIKKIRIIRENLRLIERFFKEYIDGPCNTFICNVDQPEGQFLGHLNKKHKGINHHIGGLGAYVLDSRFDRIEEPLYTKIIKKIIYGYWFETARSFAKYNYIDKIVIFRPDLISEKLEGIKVIGIPEDLFLRLAETDFTRLILNEYGLEREYDWNAIVIAPLSEFVKEVGFEKVKFIYKKILENLVSRGFRTIIKYHPRESIHDFLRISESDSLKIAPRAIPSEVLYADGKTNDKVAIGDISTGLFIFKIMNKDSLAISVVDILDFKYPENKELFIRSGIKIPKNMEELAALLNSRPQ